MDLKKLAEQAKRECSSERTTAHAGGGPGRPFWNAEAFQFMYVPAFHFAGLPGFKTYHYVAEDETGKRYEFTSADPSALLTPIWGDLPEGVIRLSVYAVDEAGRDAYLIGARTFYRLAPFSDDLPKAKCSYRECADKAFAYAMSQGFVNHWLKGTPDPDYDWNVYPPKMISAIIRAMLYYAQSRPEIAYDALKIATNAADYLISITEKEGTPLHGLPPTYYVDFRPNPETRENLTAADRIDTNMMIYPAHAGSAYLLLEEKTGERRYLEAARKIAEFYRDHVQENGSWYLVLSRITGEPTVINYCDPLECIVPFLMTMYRRTGEDVWKKLADRALAYVEREKLKNYEWEGQFEDSAFSANYSNLTHYGAGALLRYYATYYSDDEEKIQRAEDLMRFVEDQFVVWKKGSPWNKHGYDPSLWLTPAGLEQYNWHVPIDASTADIINSFLCMYKAGRGELYLAKAMALADAITRAQQPSGMIPTHWMNQSHLEGENFWINCMLSSARAMAELADFLEKR